MSPSHSSPSVQVPGGIPTLKDVGIGLALVLLVPVFFALAVVIGFDAVGWSDTAMLWALPVGTASAAVGMWWWLVRRRGWGWRELGFTAPTRSLWHLLWEAPLVMMGALVFVAIVRSMVDLSSDASSRSMAGGASSLVLNVAIVLSAVVVVPLVEEILFRRLVFDWMAARSPVWVAVIGTGVVFGLIHVVPAVVVYILPLGIGMTALRAWHGTLWASQIVHSANNGLVTVLLLLSLR